MGIMQQMLSFQEMNRSIITKQYMLFMFNKRIKYWLIPFILFAGCKKDETNFPIEPSIEVVSISPSSPKQYTDPVTITIHYKDGDGDLGENNDSIKNCFVTDNRIGITYQYRIKQLAPTGATIAIEGNLNIELGGQVLIDSVSQQSVTYTLYVVDRAGHQSNSVTTGEIVIRK
jgi:hypothetical protein